MAGRTVTYETIDGETITIGKRILEALKLIHEGAASIDQAATLAGCTVTKLKGLLRNKPDGSPGDGKKVLADMLQGGELVSLARANATIDELMLDADSDSVRLKAAQDVKDRVEGKAAQVIRHTGSVETVHRVVVGVEPAPAHDLIETAPGVFALPDDVALPSQGKAKP